MLEEPFTNVLFDRRKDNSVQLKGCSFNVLLRSMFVISLAASSLQSNGSYILSFQLINSSGNQYKDLIDELPGRREGGCWVTLFDPICTLLLSIASIEEIVDRIMTLLRLVLEDEKKIMKYGGRAYIAQYIEGGILFIYFWMSTFHIYNKETTILKVRQQAHILMTFCNRHFTDDVWVGAQQIRSKCNALSIFTDKLAVFYSKLIKGIRIKGIPLKESSALTYPHTIQTIEGGQGLAVVGSNVKVVSTNYKKQNIERLSQLSGITSDITIFGGMNILSASDDDDEDEDDEDEADSLHDAPPPLLQSGFSLTQDPSSLTVWDFHVQELARQWTLLDHQLLCSIPLSSFLSSSSKVPLWTLPRDQANRRAPVIRKCIDTFNAMTLWVTASVLSGSTPASRAVTYGVLVDLAAYFKLLKNYNGLMAVVIGLNQASVTRLTETIRLVTAKRMDTLKRLEKLMSGSKNYGNYRAKLESDLLDLKTGAKASKFRDTITSTTRNRGLKEAPQSALVPHLGALLAEIASTLESGGEYLTRDSQHHFINLDRYKLLASSLTRLVEIRTHRYNLHSIPLIQTVIHRTLQRHMKLSSVDIEGEARAFYDLSMSLEGEVQGKSDEKAGISDDNDDSNDKDGDDEDEDSDEDLFEEDDDADNKKKKSFSQSVKKTYSKLMALSGLRKKDNYIQ